MLWDDNNITIDGATALSTSEDIPARYRAAGWHVVQLRRARFRRYPPSAGRGGGRRASVAGRLQDDHRQGRAEQAGHVTPSMARRWGRTKSPLRAKILGWRCARRSKCRTTSWPTGARPATAATGVAFELASARLRRTPSAKARIRTPHGRRSAEASRLPALEEHIAALAAEPKNVASRKASEMALGALDRQACREIDRRIGGSDRIEQHQDDPRPVRLTAEDYSGRYIYYGIREFGMAAAMNGMVLHGGIVPYGGTFLIFSDYCRNAIRLSALQQVGVVYVMTHDSIGLGEDGPTHQPVEQVMSLRLIPNLNVYRPADAIETAECWALALARPETRPRSSHCPARTCRRCATKGEMLERAGAYRLRAATAERKVVLIATGSEVQLAMEVADQLEAQGVGADVVSMPCMELFDAQDDALQGRPAA